jgi:plasmid stability protein
MGSITIHNLDEELDRRIRERAQADHTSLNRAIQKLLREALGLSRKPVKYADFSDLSGTWTVAEAKEFDKNTEEFSAIDEELWK